MFRKDILVREQFFLDLCKPEYNILKVAGSNLGYIHSENTIAKMRESRLNWTEVLRTNQILLKNPYSSEDQRDKSRQRYIFE